MATIHSTDRIFATITQRGHVISNSDISGATSVSDIISSFNGKIRGLATISLRNYTQGWHRNHTVMFAY